MSNRRRRVELRSWLVACGVVVATLGCAAPAAADQTYFAHFKGTFTERDSTTYTGEGPTPVTYYATYSETWDVKLYEDARDAGSWTMVAQGSYTLPEQGEPV